MRLSLTEMMQQIPKHENNAQIPFVTALENFRDGRIDKSMTESRISVQAFRQEISHLVDNQHSNLPPVQKIEDLFLQGYYHTKDVLHSLQNSGYINDLAAERIKNVLGEIRGSISSLESGVNTLGDKGDVPKLDNFCKKATSQIVWLNEFFEQVVLDNSVHKNSSEPQPTPTN